MNAKQSLNSERDEGAHKVSGPKSAFDRDRYTQIGDDQLITLSLQLVIDAGRPPSFENVVEEAFTSFPERFCFPGHPEWPHTLVIDRSIRRCTTDRNKRWISGRAATGYKLLPAGETVAKDTLEKISGQKPLGKTSVKPARPTQSGRVVKHVEESSAFQKYRQHGEVEGVTEYDLCDLLYCTIESTPETLENNLAVLLSNVKDVHRDDLLPFSPPYAQNFVIDFNKNETPEFTYAITDPVNFGARENPSWRTWSAATRKASGRYFRKRPDRTRDKC